MSKGCSLRAFIPYSQLTEEHSDTGKQKKFPKTKYLAPFEKRLQEKSSQRLPHVFLMLCVCVGGGDVGWQFRSGLTRLFSSCLNPGYCQFSFFYTPDAGS